MGQCKSKESCATTAIQGNANTTSFYSPYYKISALLLQIITTLCLCGVVEEFLAPNMMLSGTSAKTFCWNDLGIDFLCRTFMSSPEGDSMSRRFTTRLAPSHADPEEHQMVHFRPFLASLQASCRPCEKSLGFTTKRPTQALGVGSGAWQVRLPVLGRKACRLSVDL